MSTPADRQYAETRRAAKEGVLLAFGLPESIVGNASTTHDNADAVWARFAIELSRKAR